MSTAPSKSRSELAVLVGCHTHLVAIPTRAVVRLLLLDEAGPLRASGKGGALLGTVTIGDQTCAAWDLGSMLELEPLDRAWVVVSVERAGARIPIALRTGVCALVAEVRADTSLPGRLFRSRARAFPAAFAATTVSEELPALFGLWLDPSRLFTDEEIAASRAVVEGASAELAER